ncbi:MAG: hypothetical protein KCHDKBKB_00998 [Elusimicrobia bacterium]|nr:hypothetical protein [Elusimicrobiota bacterium]
MPANINTMMYVGEKPWHGLGKRLEKAATSAEAIAAAGLNWKVDKSPLFLEGGKKVEGAFATVREDTKQVLGVVGNVYQPLQNKDAFSFFDAIVGIKEAMYHTAGALGQGECVWILAKLPGLIRVVGDDVTEKYLLLTNRHDGWGSVQVLFTPIRVVCQNTLNVALSSEGARATLRHTTTIGLRVEEVRQQLGIIQAKFGLFEEAAKSLSKVAIGQKSFNTYLKNVGLVKDEDDSSSRAKKIMDEVSLLFEHGKGNDLPGVKGTAWAAFNAVAEYADYVRPSREKNSDKGMNARAKSILFGTGATLKQKAWTQALALAR